MKPTRMFNAAETVIWFMYGNEKDDAEAIMTWHKLVRFSIRKSKKSKPL